MQTILLVEDDLDIRTATEEILKLHGYAIRTASNGREGVTQACAEPVPDLVLLDLMMPVSDGLEFLRNLRGTAAEQVKVIVLSASPGELPEGAVARLRKPYEFADLVRLIDRHLPEQALSDRN